MSAVQRKTKPARPDSETRKALDKLIDIRHQKDVSVTELAKLTGMITGILKRLEQSDGHSITFKMQDRYARAIDMELVIQLRREEA